MRREALARLEVGRVQVLRAVREEVEACGDENYQRSVRAVKPKTRTGHEKDRVNAKKPVRLEHLLRLVQENLRLVRPRPSTRLDTEALRLTRVQEEGALGRERANECGERADARGRPEERAP
jgi:hypothetical protein